MCFYWRALEVFFQYLQKVLEKSLYQYFLFLYWLAFLLRMNMPLNGYYPFPGSMAARYCPGYSRWRGMSIKIQKLRRMNEPFF